MSRWLLWMAMLALIPGSAAGVPRYFLAIHCAPHNNREADWISLVALVAAADALDLKLTIQLSTEWESLLAASGTDLETWATSGHEIGGHHHTLEPAASWDGYSNDPLASVSMRPPGYLGDMQAWIDALQAQLPAGIEVRTVASWDEDFPPGVPFQTGGSSSSVVWSARLDPPPPPRRTTGALATWVSSSRATTSR